MSGIKSFIFQRITKIAPFDEPVCTDDHHARKKEAIHQAVDINEMEKILSDKEINFSQREADLFTATVFLVRRAMVRLLNSRYFDDINLIIPIYRRITDLERDVKQLKAELARIKAEQSND